MNSSKKPNRTPIRIIKAFLFGMVVGMAALQYVRNRQRPVLALCDNDGNKSSGEINEKEKTE